MKSIYYFKTQVLRKRRYLRMEWLERAARAPIKKEAQPDGRVRAWIYVEEVGKYLRVVFVDDGTVVHNAFFDRRFKGGLP